MVASRTRNRNRNLFALGGGIGSLLGVVYLGHRYFRAARVKEKPLPYPPFSEEESEEEAPTPPQDPQFYEDEQKYIDTDDEEEEPEEADVTPAVAISEALNTTQEIAQEILPAAQAQQVAQAADAIAQVAEKVSSPKERQVVQAAVVNLVNNVAAAVEVAEESKAEESKIEEKREAPPSPKAIPVLLQRRPTRSSQKKPATATPAPRVIPWTIEMPPGVIALDTVDLPPGENVTKLTDLENQTILDSLEAYFTRLVGALINVADDPVEQRKILLANLEYYEDKVDFIRKNLEKYLESPGKYKKEIRQANADLAARMIIPEIIRDILLKLVQAKTNDPATLRAFLNQLRSMHLPRKLKLAVTEYQGLFPGGINGFRDWFEETIWNIPDETFKAAATMRKNLRESIDEILRTEQLKHGQEHASKINNLLREYFQTPNRPVADIESEKSALEKLEKKLENDRDNYFPAELASLQSQNATPEATADLMKAITKNQLQLQIIGSLLAQFEELAKKIKSQKPSLMGPLGRFVSQFAPQAVKNLLVPPEASPRKKSSRYPTRSRSRRRPS